MKMKRMTKKKIKMILGVVKEALIKVLKKICCIMLFIIKITPFSISMYQVW
jgi:hypothetical protein